MLTPSIDGSFRPFENRDRRAVYSIERSPGTLPIADDSTLESNFYDSATVDTRYPKERALAQVISEIPEARSREYAIAASEPKYLEFLSRYSKLWPKIASEAADVFAVNSPESHSESIRRLFSLPRSLRDLVFASRVRDVIDILDIVSDNPYIMDVADQKALRERTLSILDPAIETTPERAAALGEAIVKAARTQLEEEGNLVNYERMHNQRYAADAIDRRKFRQAINSGTIVDPVYLFNDSTYQPVETWSNTSTEHNIGFLFHMIMGEYQMGHNHTYLYRNRFGKVPNVQIGVPPDYNVIRPGNYLFHDLKLLEKADYGDDFPYSFMFEYLLHYYFLQTEVIVDYNQDSRDEPDFLLSGTYRGVELGLPLAEDGSNVIPFRALKRAPHTADYFEYDEDCYLAELVDIALQLDLIESKYSKQPKTTNRDRLVSFTANLGNQRTLHTIKAQLAFMDGYGIKKVNESYIIGDPEEERRTPLTCYHEWFQRFSRRVSDKEMGAKNLPVRPPLYPAVA